jgi:hypothetical protein
MLTITPQMRFFYYQSYVSITCMCIARYIKLTSSFHFLISEVQEMEENLPKTCKVNFEDPNTLHRICGVMVSMLSSSVVDRGFEPRSGQTKDYKINICCFSTKHTAQRRKNKDWLARNQNNVSQWSDMSTCGLLFQ